MGNAQVIDIDDTFDAQGGEIQTSGITLGADAQVRNNLLMGVAFDYVDSDIDWNSGGNASVQGGKGSIFGTWFNGKYHVDGMIGGGFNSYDTKRLSIDGYATGSTDGYDVEALLGGGCDHQLGQFTLSPGASLFYTRVSIAGFTETGSLAPLAIDTIDGNSLLGRLGANLTYNTKIGDVLLKPTIGVFYQYEFLDAVHSVDSRLASGAGSSFSVEDAETGRGSLPVSIGLNVQWSPRVGMHMAYEQTLLRQNASEYNVRAGVNIGL